MDAQKLERTLQDELRETLDAKHGPHPVWAGSPAAQRVAEPQRRRWPLSAMAAAAAVLVMAVVGYPLLAGAWPGGLGAILPVVTVPPSGPAGNGLIALAKDGDIVVADWPGGETRPLVTGPEDDRYPIFSPDGTRLAFLRGTEQGAALMVANADGTRVVQAVPAPGEVWASVDWGSWAFAPDSRSIVAAAAFDGEKRLLVVPVDPVGAATHPDVRLPAGWMYNEPPSFHPTNPQEILVIAQPVPDGPRVLSVYDRATGEIRTIVEETDTRVMRDVAWLPDGEHIVYTVAGEGTHMVATDGSGDRLVTWYDRESPFSNDGTRFIAGVEVGETRRSVIQRTDGRGAPVELACGQGTDPACPTDWTWSPDDSTLIGIRYDGEDYPLRETYLQVDPDSGQVTQLAWVNVGPPAWQRVAPRTPEDVP